MNLEARAHHELCTCHLFWYKRPCLDCVCTGVDRLRKKGVDSREKMLNRRIGMLSRMDRMLTDFSLIVTRPGTVVNGCVCLCIQGNYIYYCACKTLIRSELASKSNTKVHY